MLDTVDAVIMALGGTQKAAEAARVTAPAVSNWRKRQRIASDRYLLISEALRAAGKEASPAVFGFPPEAETAA